MKSQQAIKIPKNGQPLVLKASSASVNPKRVVGKSSVLSSRSKCNPTHEQLVQKSINPKTLLCALAKGKSRGKSSERTQQNSMLLIDVDKMVQSGVKGHGLTESVHSLKVASKPNTHGLSSLNLSQTNLKGT